MLCVEIETRTSEGKGELVSCRVVKPGMIFKNLPGASLHGNSPMLALVYGWNVTEEDQGSGLNKALQWHVRSVSSAGKAANDPEGTSVQVKDHLSVRLAWILCVCGHWQHLACWPS